MGSGRPPCAGTQDMAALGGADRVGMRKVTPGKGRDMPGDSCNRNLSDKLAMSGWLPSGFEAGGVAAPCCPFKGQAATQGEGSPGA